ncbi:MAG: hypothetical protein ACTH2Y_10575 [Corynebacterium sp.]|uniref:hypothetical protein n=1 Tax=Corynebacterium sp. TaxID=1720 RepID=UPI003F8FC641
MSETKQDVAEYIALKALESTLKDELDKRKTALEAAIPPGDRVTGRDAQGKAMGAATHSEPSAKATVTDRNELIAWAEVNYPELLTPVLNESDMSEALPIILEHAPHLVRTGTVSFRLSALLKDVEAGKQVAPGVELVEKPGYVSVPSSKPYKELKAFMASRTADVIGIAGVEVKELEAGDE